MAAKRKPRSIGRRPERKTTSQQKKKRKKDENKKKTFLKSHRPTMIGQWKAMIAPFSPTHPPTHPPPLPRTRDPLICIIFSWWSSFLIGGGGEGAGFGRWGRGQTRPTRTTRLYRVFFFYRVFLLWWFSSFFSQRVASLLSLSLSLSISFSL